MTKLTDSLSTPMTRLAEHDHLDADHLNDTLPAPTTHFHLMGIGGIGLSAFARLLKHAALRSAAATSNPPS